MLSFQRPRKRHLVGGSAHREIFSKLWAYPIAQQLSREVYNFYGDSLTYIDSWDFPSTTFAINLQHEPIALKSAEIKLQLGTDRVAEALTHELLHLRLPILGYPLGEVMWIPFQLDHYARDFLGMSQWVLNLVQHEIIFQSFAALGFDQRHFLADLVKPRDYRKLFDRKYQNGYVQEVDFPRWCIAYLGHLFTARHGGNEDCRRYAQDALDWGSRLHPALKRVTAAIDRWFENGAFKDPRHYPWQVNLLLGLMGIPKYNGWVMLEFSESQKPIALRLETTGAGNGGLDRAISMPFY